MNIKRSPKLWLSIGMTLALIALTFAVGTAIAQGPTGGESVTVIVNSRINYQGVLKEDGVPVTGNRSMTFRLYTNVACTTQAGSDIVKGSVPVANGLFSVDLDVDQSLFNGQGLWLRTQVGATLMGCEEIRPSPYALSLRPGAQIQGDPSAWEGWVIKANMTGAYPLAKAMLGTTATGSAIYGDSTGGYGLYGYSQSGNAIIGTSIDKTAGVFSSNGGYGIRVSTTGGDHWDHAGYFTANWGYGIYVTSTHNNALRAVGGTDLNSVWQPGGPVGVVGLSAIGSGVFGSSRDSYGTEGISRNSYGVYGESENSRGVYGTSDYDVGVYGRDGGPSPDNSYAVYGEGDIYTTDDVYVTDDLWVSGYSTFSGGKSGYVVDIAQNDDAISLQNGDVVVISGSGPAVVGEIPVIKVRRATTRETSAVVGVVDRHFMPAVAASAGKKTESIIHEADIAPGEYLTVVTLGSYKAIKVDAAYGAIAPGDLLVASPHTGYAMKASHPQAGTIIGKALAGLPSGIGVIAVLITLQ